MLVRIIYASKACPDVGEQAIDEVVEHARARNAERGITGVLAFDGIQIIQIIEGPSNVVVDLYESIRQDPRHAGVVTLAHDEIDKPSFSAWEMVKIPLAEVLLGIAAL